MAPNINHFKFLQTISLLYVSVTVIYTGSSLRHDEECSALFQFKQTIIHQGDATCAAHGSQVLYSWNTSFDYCSWEGVICSNHRDQYSHLIGLDLSERSLCGHINNNSTLFSLVHLQRLNLSGNEFGESQIPSEIARLKQLRSLDLSNSGFGGQIPNEISQLVQLSTLDLSRNALKLHSPSLKDLVQNLTGLEELHLSGVDISSYVPHFLANFSSLRSIKLTGCSLVDEFPATIVEHPKLEVLNLAKNFDLDGFLPEFRNNSLLKEVTLYDTRFFGILPESISHLKHLEVLSLSGCTFSGLIPRSLSNLTQLTYLGLGYNKFTGFVPSLVSLSKLDVLALHGNKFEKRGFPNWLGKLTKLSELYLPYMNINDEIPHFLSNLTQLSVVELSMNSIIGHIPSWLFNYTQLTTLSIAGNQLQGPILNTFSNFKNLVYLNLGSNTFSGTVEFDIFLRLNKLQQLFLGNNNISLVAGNNYTNATLAELKILEVSSCNLKEFPDFLVFQRKLSGLYLDHNNIDGLVPMWFWNNSWENLVNHFLSTIISYKDKYQFHHKPFYSLSDNNLTGEIPLWICDLKYLELLELSFNNMSGKLPSCLGSLGNSLTGLNLRRNNFHGKMTNSFKPRCLLKGLDLSENKFTGELARSLKSCTNLEFLTLGDNNFHDVFPFWMRTLSKLQVLVLRSNNLYGSIEGPTTVPSWFPKLRILDISNNNFSGHLHQNYFKTWNAMSYGDLGISSKMGSYISSKKFNAQMSYRVTLIRKGVNIEYKHILTIDMAIDLSCNNFEGEIPQSIHDLRGIQALNLSNNHFIGHVLPSLWHLKNLEALDLSRNKLSGEIPQQLVQLGFLSIFNVSFNRLEGRIPHGKQFDTFDNDSYMGNPRLCGQPLSKECEGSKVPRLPPTRNVYESESLFPRERIDWIIILFGVGSGLAIGIVFGNILYTRYNDIFINKKYRWVRPLHNTKNNSLNIQAYNIPLFIAPNMNYFKFFQTISFLYVFVTVNVTGSSLSLNEDCSALYQFKQSIIHQDDVVCAAHGTQVFQSWNTSFDCCSWEGVSCSNNHDQYGQVIGLDLSESFLCGHINSNSTIFSLVHLQRLNLSRNYFGESQIPSEISRLKQLRSLDLSYSGFSGQIPNEISQLMHLSSLDLSWNALKLHNPSLKDLVQNLTGLEELHLSRVDISSSVPHFLANFSYLRSIQLSDCSLWNEFPIAILELPKLQVLDLTYNTNLSGSLSKFRNNSLLEEAKLHFTSFFGMITESISHLKHLRVLSLRECTFSGPIPRSLSNLTQLTFLGLSGNKFTGFIPSLVTLSKLDALDLSGNKFEKGRFPNWLGKLTKLRKLYVSNMSISDEIPLFLSNITTLREVNMENNFLFGHIPSWLSNHTQLTLLDLEINQLLGPIPNTFSIFKSLQYLNLGWNNFSGMVELDMFLGLNKLQALSLGYNMISLQVTNNYTNTTLPNLDKLDLSSCNLKEFPAFLRFQNKLSALQLNHNNINGLVPVWIWNNSRETLLSITLSYNSITGFEEHPRVLPWRNLEEFTISGNQLQGQPPIPPQTTIIYDVSHNNLTRPLQLSICELKSLQLLDLSFNNMNGTLDSCFVNLSNSLMDLNLRRNNFHGKMMNAFMSGSLLKRLDLSENIFTGQLPRSLTNCTNLELLSLGDNSFHDVFPFCLENLAKLEVLILRSNKFYGPIQSSTIVSSQFLRLRIIDLSQNNFSGKLHQNYFQTWNAMREDDLGISSVMESKIFSTIGRTTSAYTVTLTHKGVRTEYQHILSIDVSIDLSCNHFEGEIPKSLQDLQGLQSLNLSGNHFSGRVLPFLGHLKNLEALDISTNKLTGEIPQQLVQLNFLAIFNVSFNHLQGRIPQGKQFDTFDNNSYMCNLRLCGRPLSKECEDPTISRLPSTINVFESESLFPSERTDWIIISCGVGSGLVIGIFFGSFVYTRYSDLFIKRKDRWVRPLRGVIASNSKGKEKAWKTFKEFGLKEQDQPQTTQDPHIAPTEYPYPPEGLTSFDFLTTKDPVKAATYPDDLTGIPKALAVIGRIHFAKALLQNLTSKMVGMPIPILIAKAGIGIVKLLYSYDSQCDTCEGGVILKTWSWMFGCWVGKEQQEAKCNPKGSNCKKKNSSRMGSSNKVQKKNLNSGQIGEDLPKIAREESQYKRAQKQHKISQRTKHPKNHAGISAKNRKKVK
ncbi:hypothetical protein LXL04_032885 [Taraxacum kok-saghyz]